MDRRYTEAALHQSILGVFHKKVVVGALSGQEGLSVVVRMTVSRIRSHGRYASERGESRSAWMPRCFFVHERNMISHERFMYVINQ